MTFSIYLFIYLFYLDIKETNIPEPNIQFFTFTN